jgi:SOS-response transcriptional repressor LexA
MGIEPINEVFGAAFSFALKGSKRGTQARIATETGVDPANVSAMKRCGKGASEEVRRLIFSKILELLPDFPAKTYDDFLHIGRWILDGHDPEQWKPPLRDQLAPTMANVPAKISPNISPGPPVLSKIPIISWVRAGDWAEVVDPYQPGYAEEWIDTTATRHPNAFALVVRGDSMAPEFIEGEIITVDPGREAVNGSYVVAKNGDEATFKQLVFDGPNVFLKPLNKRYPIRDMTGINFRIIGVVVEKVKRY